MRGRRIVMIAAGVAALFAVAVFGLSGPVGAAVRSQGDLALAVVNAHAGVGTPRTRIATDGAHPAVLSREEVTWFDSTGTQYRTPVATPSEVARLFDDHAFYNWHEDLSTPWSTLLAELVTPLLLGGLLIFVFRHMRGGGLGRLNLQQRRERIASGQTPTATFADVAGCDEATTELAEVVAALRDPARFAALGARIPRGVLLTGAPGTGKTLLARAVAGEAGAPFFSLSASEFVEMWAGIGARRVRELFAEARKRAPSIIFIDEIDAVGRRRGSGMGSANEEREQTLNQLLVEMDGFDNSSPVIVIAATNRGDVLDHALLRPGRFDRRIAVDLPDICGRRAILDVHARGKPLAAAVDLGDVARQTVGFSGADLANLLNESALLAARHHRTEIGPGELDEACIRVLAGPARNPGLMSAREREIIAHHEMGHALVAHTLPGADPVHRISIVARGQALGWTMILPERDQILFSRAHLTDKLACLLGGRCSEELVFGGGEITSGAADDIDKATRLAHRMVTELSMSPLGMRSFLSADPGIPRAYSEDVAAAVDAEVDHLLQEAAERARQILRPRRALLLALARRLLEVETMEAEEMGRIIAGFPVHPAPRPSIVVSLPLRPGDRIVTHGGKTVAAITPAVAARPAEARDSPAPRTGAWLRVAGAFMRLARRLDA